MVLALILHRSSCFRSPWKGGSEVLVAMGVSSWDFTASEPFKLIRVRNTPSTARSIKSQTAPHRGLPYVRSWRRSGGALHSLRLEKILSSSFTFRTNVDIQRRSFLLSSSHFIH